LDILIFTHVMIKSVKVRPTLIPILVLDRLSHLRGGESGDKDYRKYKLKHKIN